MNEQNTGGVFGDAIKRLDRAAEFAEIDGEALETLRQQIMTLEFNTIYQLATDKQIDMRTAAYAQALNRIGEAIEAQGTSRYFAADAVE